MALKNSLQGVPPILSIFNFDITQFQPQTPFFCSKDPETTSICSFVPRNAWLRSSHGSEKKIARGSPYFEHFSHFTTPKLSTDDLVLTRRCWNHQKLIPHVHCHPNAQLKNSLNRSNSDFWHNFSTCDSVFSTQIHLRPVLKVFTESIFCSEVTQNHFCTLC